MVRQKQNLSEILTPFDCPIISPKKKRKAGIFTAKTRSRKIRKERYSTEGLVQEAEISINDRLNECQRLVLEMANQNQLIITKFNIEILKRDIVTLFGTTWLNDNIINFYFALLSDRYNVFSFDCFFLTSLSAHGFQSVKTWTREVDIFSWRSVFFPINITGSHWILIEAKPRQKVIVCYDSQYGTHTDKLVEVFEYLILEHLDKKGENLIESEWSLFHRRDIPRQYNNNDCGVFICKFGEFISRDVPFSFDESSMQKFRRCMVFEICNGHLFNEDEIQQINTMDSEEHAFLPEEESFSDEYDAEDYPTIEFGMKSDLNLCQKYASNFADYQNSFTFNTCSKCFKGFYGLSLTNGLCSRTCEKFFARNEIQKFGPENNMHPGEVPEELKRLTFIEQQLIALAHPVISVFKLKRGGQLGYSGHVISFSQNVRQFAKVLPSTLNDLTNILVVRKGSENDFSYFIVNKTRILLALIWLQKHNPFYKEIEIKMSNLGELADVSNVLDRISKIELKEDKAETVGEQLDSVNSSEKFFTSSDVPDLNVFDPEKRIQEILGVSWPEKDEKPLNEFEEYGLFCKCFPHLFPYGAADFKEARVISVTMREYLKHLILFHDQRFALDDRFRFYALNRLMRMQTLSSTSICISKNKIGIDTFEVVKQKLLADKNFINQILCYNQKIHGSNSYWYKQSRILKNQIKQLGPPTLFFTLTAADLYWKYLPKYLDPEHHKEFEQLNNLEYTGRNNKLVNSNPLITTWFFKMKSEFFIKKILIPMLKVIDWWYRVEFQGRGSPHIHGVLWLPDAPDITKLTKETPEDELEKVANYFDGLICAINPNLTQIAPEINPCRKELIDVLEKKEDVKQDLSDLLDSFQRHTKHTTCLRKVKNSEKAECRFKFPKDLCEKSCLKWNEQKNYFEFIPRRNDALLNTYNPSVTQLFRSNTDFQAVVSTYVIERYISKYISKTEKKTNNYLDVLKDLIDQADCSKKLVNKILNKSIAERDYSAQETLHLLMEYPLVSSSRTEIAISLDLDSEQTCIFKEFEEVEIKVFKQQDFFEQYFKRPNQFQGFTFIDFFKKINKTKAGYVQRAKEHIINLYAKKQDDEFNALVEILSTYPFNGFADLYAFGRTFKDISTALKTQKKIDCEQIELEKMVTNDSSSEEELVNEIQKEKEEWMLISESSNNLKVNRLDLGKREFDLKQIELKTLNNEEIKIMENFIGEQKTSFEIPLAKQTQQVQFSASQQQVLSILEAQINSTQDITMKRTLVIGEAGSGKSTLIREIEQRVKTIFGQDAIKILAPTGVAALNVNGSTIYSGLKIGFRTQREGKSYTDKSKMTGSKLQKFQADLKNLKFLIIDEIGMVSCSLLEMINVRLKEAKPQTNEFFGGVFIFFFGDFNQLPPIGDCPLYRVYEQPTNYDQGRICFKSIQKCVFLGETFRQQGEKEQKFRTILNNVAKGNVTKDDWMSLMQRSRENLSQNEINSFKDATRLYYSNELVNNFNRKKLESLMKPIYFIEASNNNSSASRSKVDGLPSILQLCKGARIMLRHNVWTEVGLVNGSIGTIDEVIYLNGTSPPEDMPRIIMVRFEKYNGPSINGCVPIQPITRKWENLGSSCSRTQFPIVLAYSMTIHKSQGLTLDKVSIDIGSREFSLGVTYVGISRVRSFADILFEKSYDFKRFSSLKNFAILTHRNKELERLRNLN